MDAPARTRVSAGSTRSITAARHCHDGTFASLRRLCGFGPQHHRGQCLKSAHCLPMSRLCGFGPQHHCGSRAVSRACTALERLCGFRPQHHCGAVRSLAHAVRVHSVFAGLPRSTTTAAWTGRTRRRPRGASLRAGPAAPLRLDERHVVQPRQTVRFCGFVPQPRLPSDGGLGVPVGSERLSEGVGDAVAEIDGRGAVGVGECFVVQFGEPVADSV